MTKPRRDEPYWLWDQYLDQRTDALRNQLVEHYWPLVRWYARKLMPRTPDELLGAGAIGLIGGVERCDPARCKRPSHYLGTRINGAMIDELRRLDHGSRLQRRRNREIEQAESAIGRQMTDEEIRDSLGYARPVTDPPISLDQRDETTELLRFDQRPEAQRYSLTRANYSELSWLLQGLRSRDRLMIVLYMVEGLKMEEVARELGISESRVSQRMAQLRPLLQQRACAA